jgi:hypothetical protein
MIHSKSWDELRKEISWDEIPQEIASKLDGLLDLTDGTNDDIEAVYQAFDLGRIYERNKKK